MLSMTPNNMEEEKLKFFEKNGEYNPGFTYKVKKIRSRYSNFELLIYFQVI